MQPTPRRPAPRNAAQPPLETPVEPLFNGVDLDGWTMDVPELDRNPAGSPPFVVRGGLLVSLGKPGGHLITDRRFADYRLVVEYRFPAKPGNCGVLVHASTPRRLYKMFPQSIEVQLQHEHAGDFWCIGEDIVVPDMETRRGPKSGWGVEEGKARRIVRLGGPCERRAGEWNTMTVECRGPRIVVRVNGALVNDGEAVSARSGRIALQAEGSVVEFRRVDLQPLAPRETVSPAP